MEYQYYDEKSYNLNLFKTTKFKTITVMVNFRREIKKEEITLRSFINSILLLSSKNFSSERLSCKEMERIYTPYIGSNELRLGNYALTSFYIKIINEKYTEPGMNEQSLAFFKEMLFNPDVNNGAFNKRSFNIVKNDIKAKLRSIKDNPRNYSMIRMLENMDPDSPSSYRGGYLEEIDNIDEKKVYEYYKSMLNSDIVDIFVIGDIDFAKMREMIKKMIPINTIKKQKDSIYITHKITNKRVKKVKEEEHLSQSKLVIGCKIASLTDYERKYVLPVYSGILGGPSYSKLFQTVREKNSLAYYIYCNYNRGDNILTISSGINKESYNKALKLIRQEFNNMAKGNIALEEIDRTKEDMLSVIESIEDKPIRLINSYVSQFLYNLDDIETRKKEIPKVTIDDVKNISKKIQMDTVYLLSGSDDDETDSD